MFGLTESSIRACERGDHSCLSSGDGGDFVPVECSKCTACEAASECVSDGTDSCVSGLPPDHHSIPVTLVEAGASTCRSEGGPRELAGITVCSTMVSTPACFGDSHGSYTEPDTLSPVSVIPLFKEERND